MKNKQKLGLVVFTIVLIMVIFLCLFIIFLSDMGSKKSACIYLKGELLYRLELDGECKEFAVNTDNGYNIVCIKDGKIGIIDADCPDKTCIKTGFTDSPLIPVICMPHRLEIVIEDYSLETDGVSR